MLSFGRPQFKVKRGRGQRRNRRLKNGASRFGLKSKSPPALLWIMLHGLIRGDIY